jgi:hypothetical protein
METNNKLEQIANSETTKMISAILKGEKVDAPQNAVASNKTEQDILKAVTDSYKEIIDKKG